MDRPAVPVLVRLPLLLPSVGWLAGLLLTRADGVALPLAAMLAVAGLLLGLRRSLRPFALAIAQAGVHNRFGFPRSAVLRRYLAIGAHVWNTAKGAVIVRWAGDGESRVQQLHCPPPGRRDRALQWWQGTL